MFHCPLNDIPSLYLNEKIGLSNPHSTMISQISHLIFDDKFDCSLSLTLCSITHLSFGKRYNKRIRLTRYLLYIKFGDDFNSHFDTPRKILHLRFGYSFNKPFKLSRKLRYLKLGYCFSQPIQTSKNMHTLIFDVYYNRDITIPKSLKYLTLGMGVPRKLILPSDIEHLDMGYGKNSHLNLERLSQNAHIIVRTNYPEIYDHLPNNVRHVHFSSVQKPKPYGRTLPNRAGTRFDYIMGGLHMNNLPNSVIKSRCGIQGIGLGK